MEAIVEYNYEAQESDELTIRKGDVIKDIKVMAGGWWEGNLRDKRGMFPDNFVKVIETSSGMESASSSSSSLVKIDDVVLRNGGSGQGRRWCKVQFSYEPCNEDELALNPQDSLEFLGEVEEGWWRGRLRGRIGVFPSNFVSPPSYEDNDKEKNKREFCRVLFPYEALNEDELTLAEGEMLAIISKDAPDKGWWKGELRGRVGLFPDNFVELIGSKSDSQHDSQPSYSNGKSSVRNSVTTKRTEKAHARRSLDVHNVPQPSISSKTRDGLLSGDSRRPPSSAVLNEQSSTILEGSRKSSISTSSSSSSSANSGLMQHMTITGDKKSNGSQIMTSLKRLVGGGGNSNGSNNLTIGTLGIDDELDGVQRGEGAPLSHPTASRARLPRRRLPSSQHLRHQNNTVNNVTTPIVVSHPDSNLANGNAIIVPLERLREEEVESGDSRTAKGRRMAPWVEELKLNQLERRKPIISPVEKSDKPEIKKPRSIEASRTSSSSLPLVDNNIKTEMEVEIVKKIEDNIGSRSKETVNESVDQQQPPPPPFVPYPMYCQLLERVAMLEEKQTMMQQTIDRLTEQLAPLLQAVNTTTSSSSSTNNNNNNNKL